MVSNNIDSVKKWIDEILSFSMPIQQVPLDIYNRTGLQWDVLRTDLIHPVCSGNKLFKLKYYLLEAIQKNYTMIHTEGGPWSNHIVATAFACDALKLAAKGIISGDEPKQKSITLTDATAYNMHLQYKGWGSSEESTIDPNSYCIPQGGYGSLGAKGAKEILSRALAESYTHILCAVGTGTMLAGLSQLETKATFIGIPVLKHEGIKEEIIAISPSSRFELIHDYHFAGYAKKTPELLAFMNSFYSKTKIPTDFVYTAKLMYAIQDLIQNDYFPVGSKILAIHSGGLQGNRSLTNDELIF